MRINRHYLNLPENYLFSTVAAKTRAFQAAHPTQKLLKLSIGDVSRPLSRVVVRAMVKACREMGHQATFRGYGPETGYPWLQKTIAAYYQREKGVTVAPETIMISDGAKSDLANLLDIFGLDATVAMSNPGYPVYAESNLMLGRQPRFFDATAANDFLPLPTPDCVADIIYLCNPSNPTGVVYTREQLQQWVTFAQKHQAIIIYDAAYANFITDPQIPTSIYQIAGANTCAIEVCSLSKMAGFTGVRCGYTIVPQQLQTADGVALWQLWRRRQTAKFNGVGYVVQRGAAAVFTSAGLAAMRRDCAYYRRNVALLRQTLTQLNFIVIGGQHSPYLWVRCPHQMTSWQFFDYLLEQAGIVCTPGIGFGTAGENYVRFTGFNTYAQTKLACARLRTIFPAKP